MAIQVRSGVTRTDRGAAVVTAVMPGPELWEWTQHGMAANRLQQLHTISGLQAVTQRLAGDFF